MREIGSRRQIRISLAGEGITTEEETLETTKIDTNSTEANHQTTKVIREKGWCAAFVYQKMSLEISLSARVNVQVQWDKST